MVDVARGGRSKPAREKISLSRREAKAIVTSVFISMGYCSPPKCQRDLLDAAMDRILQQFEIEMDVCEDCGTMSLDGVSACEVTDDCGCDTSCTGGCNDEAN